MSLGTIKILWRIPIVVVAIATLWASSVSAKTDKESAAKGCNITLSDAGSQRLVDSGKGRALFTEVSRVFDLLPNEVDEMIFAFPKATVAELADKILSLQTQQADDLRRLAMALDEEDSLKRALLRTAKRITPSDGIKERVQSIKAIGTDLYFPFFPELAAMDPKIRDPYNKLTSLLSISHGAVAELKMAFLLPDFHSHSRRVSALVPKELQKVLSSKGYPEGGNPFLDLEIDVVFNGGTSWAEVKHLKKTTTITKVSALKKRARNLAKVARAMRRMGIHIEIVYVFLRGGIGPRAREDLEKMGITVYDGSHFSEFHWPPT